MRRRRKRSLAVELVKRAEVILMLAAGHSYREVRQRLDCSDEYIREWKKRFQEERLAGLDLRYRGSQSRNPTAETGGRILEGPRQGPTRRTPPRGRAERHGFEYCRHGTLSLYAALDTRTGDVMAKTTARHTSAEFVDFLGQIVASQPEGREIHIVADNWSAHKTKNVFEFLQANPTVRIHYTPTYSSWLNQVEIWFSKIQRDVIARGIFTSTTDLSRKLMRYIRNYNKTATPIRWIYKNLGHRIAPAAI